MTRALTQDQITQVVENTVVVLLARPDLMAGWHGELFKMMVEARDASIEEEALFLAAVLTLLHSPSDALPTGTRYDYAWELLLTGLQTGMLQPSASQGETMTIDRLLHAVVEAVEAVMTRAPEQKTAVRGELRQIQKSAHESDIGELAAWLSDVLRILDGTPVADIAPQHTDIYHAYWDALVEHLAR